MGSDFWQINQKSQQTTPLEQPLRPMSRSSRLGLSDLRNEQATILGEMEDRGGAFFSPSLRDRARAASVAAEAVYSAKKRPGGGGSLDTPVGVAAIQARTNALSAELEFHQDLLNQLLTPPGKQSSKSVEPLQTSTLRNEQQNNNNNTAADVPESIRRGTYWGTYSQEEGREAPPRSARATRSSGNTTPRSAMQTAREHAQDTKTEEMAPTATRADARRTAATTATTATAKATRFSPSATSASSVARPRTRHYNDHDARDTTTVGDAYGTLLSELQAVRHQVSRFVETANVSPLSHLRMPTSAAVEVSASERAHHMMEKDNERGESGDERGVSRSEMEGRKGARHARNAAMKKYRARLLEVINIFKAYFVRYDVI